MIFEEELILIKSLSDISLQFPQQSLGQEDVFPNGCPKEVALLLVNMFLREGADFLTY